MITAFVPLSFQIWTFSGDGGHHLSFNYRENIDLRKNFKNYFLGTSPFFRSLSWFCHNIASVLRFGFLAMRRVGSSQPGVEAAAPALGSEAITTGPQGKSQDLSILHAKTKGPQSIGGLWMLRHLAMAGLEPRLPH